MRQRIKSFVSGLPNVRFTAAAGVRHALADGYGWAHVRHDVMAGMVVGIVALPLAMALAIASGVPPQHGLYTAIVAGAVVALLGGSRVQVSGPTAAFVVILAPIAAHMGIGGLMMATVLAGCMLVLMGMIRLGRLIEFIPYPVTCGFTAGIAVVIATLQVKDFLGLRVPHMPESYVERVAALYHALPTVHMPDVAIGACTLALLLTWPRVTRKIPSPLVALVFGALLAFVLTRWIPGFSVDTISSRFSYLGRDGVMHAGVPRLPPTPVLPWLMAGPDGRPLTLSFGLFEALLGPAFAIAMLGAIESLLSAVVADGMTGFKHDPDAELVGQGIGNILAPFFCGIAATGAIARTATNIRSGGRSPIAAVVHALFVLLAVLVLSPLLGYLPMASLAALLLLVAWNMSEFKHFMYVVRVAPNSDVFVLLICFALTVILDMTKAVPAGVVMAAMLFMRRMAELSGVKLVGEEHPVLDLPLPPSVRVYEIAGPLFFGAAQKAMSELRVVDSNIRCVVLSMEEVPHMDATGLVTFESTVARLHRSRVFVILGGVQPQPAEVLAKAGWRDEPGKLAIRDSFEHGVALARAHTALAD